jgi:hypothetical protein
MSSSFGHLTLVAPAEASPAPDPAGQPPAEALKLVDAAWDIAERMACRDRELHFGPAGVELRTLRGGVVYEVSASEAVEIMCGLIAA